MSLEQLESNKLTREEFPQTWKVLSEGLSEKVAPGFAAGLWRSKDPDQIKVCALGSRRTLPSALDMTVNTVFDLASVSKVFATTALTAVLVQRGWLSWDSPVCAFFPDYPYRKIEVRHLLSHTAGLVSWHPLWETLIQKFAPEPLYSVSIEKRQKAMRKLVLSFPPEHDVEEVAVYSDLSFLLLGFVLEEVTQMPLDQAVKKMLWGPMGLSTPFFHRIAHPAGEKWNEKVAATEDSSWRGGILQGQVHDDNCWAMGGYGGHAGAFGTVRDLLYFSKRLFEGYFSAAVLGAMWTRVSKPEGCERTLGWDTPSGDNPAVGPLFSPRSVGHLGYTGTSLWIDPEANLAVALLTNRVHPSRENALIKDFRPRFHEAIRLDLGC